MARLEMAYVVMKDGKYIARDDNDFGPYIQPDVIKAISQVPRPLSRLQQWVNACNEANGNGYKIHSVSITIAEQAVTT